MNNNISNEIKQSDICSPKSDSNRIPFIICWHLANVSFSDSNSGSKSSLRKSSVISSNLFSDENISSKKISPIAKKEISITIIIWLIILCYILF